MKIFRMALVVAASGMLIASSWAGATPPTISMHTISSETTPGRSDRAARSAALQRGPSVQSKAHIDFVSGATEVVAMQFDIDLNGLDAAQVNLAGCGKGSPETHQVFCHARPDGTIRVLVESALVPLTTSTIAVIEFVGGSGQRLELIPDSILMSDASAQAVSFEVLK